VRLWERNDGDRTAMTRREQAGDFRGAVRLGLVVDSYEYPVRHVRAGWARTSQENGKGRPSDQRGCVVASAENEHVGAIAAIEQGAAELPSARSFDVLDLAGHAKRHGLLTSCMIHGVSADHANDRREQRSRFCSDCYWTVFGLCERIVMRDAGHPVLLCSDA
jgi:hypothetical protein